MDIDITQKLRRKMNAYPRVRGRYNASELYFINNGKTTPEEWIKPSPRTMKEILNMWTGSGVHNQLENLLGKEHSEKKIAFVYKDIVLVAKVDYLPPDYPDEVWEWKTSDSKMDKAKPWHLHQTKLYCSMFDRKRGRVYQPLKNDNGLYLKEMGMVERDDRWFEEELEKLYKFHLRVEELWGN